jgi:hypothetical protein
LELPDRLDQGDSLLSRINQAMKSQARAAEIRSPKIVALRPGSSVPIPAGAKEKTLIAA